MNVYVVRMSAYGIHILCTTYTSRVGGEPPSNAPAATAHGYARAMGSTPKKAAKSPVPRSPSRAGKDVPKRRLAPKSARLSREVAELKMIEATIDLLLKLPPADVTVHRIAKAADVHHDYVARYFGSREELLVRALDHGTLDTALKLGTTNVEQLSGYFTDNQDVVAMFTLRARLISYLLACGVSPERFRPLQSMLLTRAQMLNQVSDLSTRSQRNLLLIGILLVNGIGIMSEVNDMTDQEIQDLFAFIGKLRSMGRDIENTMNWGTA